MSTIQLLEPENLVANPDFTILIPTCNEELTISQFIDWCHEGINSSGLVGEILIVDSSTDGTASIALSQGARVLVTQKRGLGQAYIDGFSFARSNFLVLGDADCTYDFRDVKDFIDKLTLGYDFVMGSRWIGTIERKSMPVLHQYFGTPITTWILNFLFGSSFSDIHCGMRGITLEAFKKMDIKGNSWEYASEMVIKSVLLDLKTTEVPVNFYKDQPGRVSHHKRNGWLSPFQAAWVNLKMMLIYRLDFLTLVPGIFLTTIGLGGSFLLLVRRVSLGHINFNLLTLLSFGFVTLMGEVLFLFGFSARQYYFSRFQSLEFSRVARFRSVASRFSGFFILTGLVSSTKLLIYYLSHNEALPDISSLTLKFGFYGLFLFSYGVILMFYALMLNLFE